MLTTGWACSSGSPDELSAYRLVNTKTCGAFKRLQAVACGSKGYRCIDSRGVDQSQLVPKAADGLRIRFGRHLGAPELIRAAVVLSDFVVGRDRKSTRLNSSHLG